MEDITGIGKLAEQLPELTKELREIIVKIVEPGAEELGLIFGDYFRRVRTINLIKGLKKTQRILGRSNLPAQSFQTKVVLPILEGMSQENNENLQDKWARLLASEISGVSIRPRYVQILSALTPLDASVLDTIYHNDSEAIVHRTEPVAEFYKLEILERDIEEDSIAVPYIRKRGAKKFRKVSKIYNASQVFSVCKSVHISECIDALLEQSLCTKAESIFCAEMINGKPHVTEYSAYLVTLRTLTRNFMRAVNFSS
ncbi:Abi-alpha family protein [Pleurocapsa sp. PCC 7319]|uniref:Abi-alpha family protein n=1 Tax=Pleurocapsa sp. PCC 7319 TaxID=118161 RepID=UPI000349E706|nr:Abi-alpha family protein [Pleurocapsa sp. PCC 7319]